MQPKTQPLLNVRADAVNDLNITWRKADLTWLAWRSLGENVFAQGASLTPFAAHARWERSGDNILGYWLMYAVYLCDREQ